MGRFSRITVPLILIFLLCSLIITADGLPAVWSTSQADSCRAPLQFTGDGHVLGFTPYGVYVAAGDHALKVEFVNGLPVQPTGQGEGAGSNAAVPLDKVTYSGVWKGVDVVYTASSEGIAESAYYLDAPARVDSIRLHYNRPVRLDQQGNLVMAFENGNMVESAPVAWQEVDGQRKLAEAKYVLYGQQEVGFALDDCRSGVPVVIDPMLSWNTFLGGGYVEGNGIAVDSGGNVYVTGESYETWGNPVRPFSGSLNAFAAKLNSNGGLAWNTFLGGGNDAGNGIAVDQGGNVYVAGVSYETWGSPVRAFTGFANAFAAKLNSSGGLAWNTFLGGGNDYGRAIAVDPGGNVYVTGYSGETWGNPVRPFSGSQNAFAAKVNGSGGLAWNTFLGAASDNGYGIAVDSGGNVYVTGQSNQTWGNPVQPFTGSYNAFAARLDNNGHLTWNTFLGAGNDEGNGIAVDPGGNVYVTGTGFETWGNPVRPFSGSLNAFAARLNSSGGLVWNTFLGGGNYDVGTGIAVDSGGTVYVAGYSHETWGSPVRAFTGFANAFAAGLNSSGGLAWNTFLGGGGDIGNGIALDVCGNVYVTGSSGETWGSPVRAFTGTYNNAFVAKISNPRTPTITSFSPTTGGSGTVVTVNGTNLSGATAVSFGGTPAASFTVDSATQITATVGAGTTGRVTIAAPCGTTASAGDFRFLYPTATRPYGSSMSGVTAPPQQPVLLPSISVQSASLSATKVAPDTPVTVTARVANTGAVNGTTRLTLYVNGQEESSQGVTVSSGSSTPISFTVSRNEPSTYTVYVGGVSAGSFVVDQFADTNMILYISGALILFAFAIGVIYATKKRQQGR